MEILVNRKWLRPEYTIGIFSINGKKFCNTLEDKVRDYNKDGDLDELGETKVYGETAIPYGHYKVVLSYSPKFKRVMPRVLNVKHFDGILIHNGVTNKHTLGCILIGDNSEVGKLSNGKFYLEKLIKLLEDAEARKEEIWLTII